ncbi:unnamed protein product [Mytilus edulis]|uniref:Endonuclease/exonuclease/phosphatase domain-containing protein n=1 Tax=Mytilus edulis TaxID=6550 RepID=A0A8S3T601_MYTED|nr:unnamed protein product [Mytilus edulis]
MKNNNKRVKNDDPNNSESAVLYAAINTLTEKVNSVFDSLSSRMDNLEKKFEDGLSEKIADAVRKVVHEEFGKEISNFKKQINQDIGNIKSDLDKLTKSYAEVAKPSANNKKCNIVIKKPSPVIRESVLNFLNLDIIGVCETFLKNDDNIEISGYQWYGHNRKFKNAKTKRGSGGVGVLIKDEVLDNFSVSILDSSVEDILWIKLSHKYDDSNNICFCVCYLPPEGSSRLNDGEKLYNDLLQQVYCYQNEGFVYIGGDVNSRCGSEQDYIQGVDDINDREIIDVFSNKYGDLLIDFLTSCNLCMLNGRADGRSVVDYVFTSHEQLDMCTSCDKSIPDHGSIVWTVNVKKGIACDTSNIGQAPNKDRPRFNLKRFPLNFLDTNTHIQDTIDKNEHELVTNKDINSAYTEFVTLIEKEMKDTVPLLKTPTGPSSNKRNKSLRKPYWTEEGTS